MSNFKTRVKSKFLLFLSVVMLFTSFVLPMGAGVASASANVKPGWTNWGYVEATAHDPVTGNIFAVDSTDKVIRIFNSDESLIQTLTGFANPNEVAVAPNGDLYVVEIYDNKAILVFGRDPGTGQYSLVNQITRSDQNFEIEFDPAGKFYVGGPSSNIQVYNVDGSPDYTIPIIYATGIAFDASGNLYVTSMLDNAIYKFAINPDGGKYDLPGTIVFGVKSQSGLASEGKLYYPSNIQVGQNGIMYVMDMNGLHMLKADYSYWKTLVPQSQANVSNIHIIPNGNVWVSNTWENRIQEYTADGTYVRMLGDIPKAPAVQSIVAAPGVAEGSTSVTAATYESNTLVVQVSAVTIDTPYVGSLPPVSATSYSVGADITGVDPVTNKYVAVYELDASGKVFRFSLLELGNGDINIPRESVPELLNVSATKGQTGGTTVIQASGNPGNQVAVKISSTPISIPYVGDVLQRGSDVLWPYTGYDFGGVDAVMNKYVGVYEVDSQGTIVKFKLLVLTADEITPVTPVPDNILGDNGNPLKLVFSDQGEIRAFVWQEGSYVRQYYGENDWGTMLYVTKGGNVTRYVNPYYDEEESNVTVLPTGLLRKVDNNTVVVEWLLDDGNLKLTQTSRYVPGSREYEKSWSVQNLSSSDSYSDLKLFHGGDAYFGGIDDAKASWNEELNMIYLRNEDMDKYGIMGFYGSDSSPADRYYGGDYSTGVNGVYAGELPNTVSPDFEDAGYQLQWNRDELVAGQQWNIVSYEFWTGPGEVKVMSPASQSIERGSQVQVKFVVQSLFADAGGLPILANFDLSVNSPHGWMTSIDGDQTIELNGGDSKVVKVNVTVPSDTLEPSAELILKATARTALKQSSEGKSILVVLNKAPVASSVSIAGTAQVGQMLTGSYAYIDEENDAQGATTFKWYRSDAAQDGNKSVIDGATSSSYTLELADVGKFISFEVTPVALTGTVTGSPLESGRTAEVTLNKAPVASNASIAGTAQVGQTLTGSYTYYDEENDAQGATTFKWYRSDAAQDGNKSVIDGATSISYTLVSADIGKFISFEVSPIALTGTVTGSPIESGRTAAVVVRPSGGGGGVSSGTEEINVNVETGGNAVSKTKIVRETASDGSKKDRVTLQQSSVEEALAKAKEINSNAIRIVIPDTGDVVSELKVEIPRGTLQLLKDSKADVEIFTDNMRIVIPYASLSAFDEDLFFRFVPIKEKSKQQEVEERAKKEEMIKKLAGNEGIKIWGRPMVVETNMENSPVTLIMPLGELPTDAAARQALLDSLVIFIEHDDGTKELVKGELVEYKNGSHGIQFRTNKFSTFTMVHMPDMENGKHAAYLKGFKDGTFRPEAEVSRAEMAAMLGRNMSAVNNTSAPSFKDITDKHWAYEEIATTSSGGILEGYEDGTFRPTVVVTRAQMAAIVSRWLTNACTVDVKANAACGKLAGAATFKDVNAKHWAADEIHTAAAAGIMTGGANNTFRPDEALTRAEAVKVLNRIFNRGPLNGDLKPTFSDVPSTSWAFREVEEAAKDHQWFTEKGVEYMGAVK